MGGDLRDQVAHGRSRLRLVEKDLAELGIAGHLFERTDIDAGMVDGDEQVTDAAAAGLVGLGSKEPEEPGR